MPEKTNETFDAVTTVTGALTRNSSNLLQIAGLGGPGLAMASFAVSSIIRFIELGRELQQLQAAAQKKMVNAVRAIATPSSPLAPDPDLQLATDVTDFFVFAGEVHPELETERFQEIHAAFKTSIDIVVRGDHGDPAFRPAFKDLTFVFTVIVPAYEDGMYADPVLQALFGHMLAGGVQGLRTTLEKGRAMGLDRFSQTKNWYTEHLSDQIFWELNYRFGAQLVAGARARIEGELKEQVKEAIVKAIFAEDGQFDSTLTALQNIETQRTNEANAKLGARKTQLTRRREDLVEDARVKQEIIDERLAQIDIEQADTADNTVKEVLEKEKTKLTRERAAIDRQKDRETAAIDRQTKLIDRQVEDLGVPTSDA